jgi:hypothetical protein
MPDELFTVAEVATFLRVSGDTVVRRFAKLPGVIDIGRAETRAKRRYRVLRIPKTVVEKFLVSRGGTLRIEIERQKLASGRRGLEKRRFSLATVV